MLERDNIEMAEICWVVHVMVSYIMVLHFSYFDERSE